MNVVDWCSQWAQVIQYDRALLFLENASGTTTAHLGGGLYLAAGAMDLIYCTFSTNVANSGGALYQAAGTAGITNCIFREDGAATIGLEEIYGASLSIQDSGVDTNRVGGSVSYAGFISGADPAFVNASRLDFRLTAASPLRDMGILVPGIPTDLAGERRRQGLAPEPGAYEVGTGSGISILVR